jgi:hypothetical protein
MHGPELSIPDRVHVKMSNSIRQINRKTTGEKKCMVLFQTWIK